MKYLRSGLLVLAAGLMQGGPSVEQTSQGTRPPVPIVASFDGLGVGFASLQPSPDGRNPSDNSLAVGPNHIVQIVNSRFAVFTKKGAMFDTTGKLLYGAVPTNTIFAGFGGQCEARNNGDAVVRYDQLANRWLYVMPIFRRPANDSTAPYSMCYALSQGADPNGTVLPLRVQAAALPGLPAPRRVARRLLRPDEHERRLHPEARVRRRAREDAEGTPGARTVHRDRRRELPQQRRHRRTGRCRRRARPTS